MVVRDLPWVLSDPAEHLVNAVRSVDQSLHGEEGVVAHLLMNEVPGLLLAVVHVGVWLVVWRREVRDLGVRVVVLMWLVVGSVGIHTALVERRRETLRRQDVMLMRGEGVMMILQHGLPSPHQANAATRLAPSTTVQTRGIHGKSSWSQTVGRLCRQGKSPAG